MMATDLRIRAVCLHSKKAENGETVWSLRLEGGTCDVAVALDRHEDWTPEHALRVLLRRAAL
jgi:hypothetical protein